MGLPCLSCERSGRQSCLTGSCREDVEQIFSCQWPSKVGAFLALGMQGWRGLDRRTPQMRGPQECKRRMGTTRWNFLHGHAGALSRCLIGLSAHSQVMIDMRDRRGRMCKMCKASANRFFPFIGDEYSSFCTVCKVRISMIHMTIVIIPHVIPSQLVCYKVTQRLQVREIIKARRSCFTCCVFSQHAAILRRVLAHFQGNFWLFEPFIHPGIPVERRCLQDEFSHSFL